MKSQKTISTLAIIATLLLMYWIGIFRHIELPGIYMDAINPDYLVAHRLNPVLNNPEWTLPTAWFPILGQLYHGVQNFYVGLPLYWLFGLNVVSARIVHALFGAVIIAFVFILVQRTTRSLLLAAVFTIGLATDIAFISSFRTQNYIILGGLVWLLGSLVLLSPNEVQSISKKRLLASGGLFGLAVYAYFVFLFFFPAMLYIVQKAKCAKTSRSWAIWLCGVAIGMLPYVIGYLSMWLALGGTDKFLEYLSLVTDNLAPLSSKLTLIESYKYILDMVKLAMSNGGNEALMFGKAVSSSHLSAYKFFGFLTMLALLFIFLIARKNIQENSWGLQLVLLPSSYLLVAGLLGARLGAHHFSVLVPFFYLLAGIVCHEFVKLLARVVAGDRFSVFHGSAVASVLILMLAGNMIQQQQFFAQLDHTGGTGAATSALTTLANDALAEPSGTVYIFPEWGFFMSFAFITQSRVPYWLDASKESVEHLSVSYKHVSIPFWKKEDAPKYEEILHSAGAGVILMRTFLRRDGSPAFYMLTASF